MFNRETKSDTAGSVDPTGSTSDKNRVLRQPSLMGSPTLWWSLVVIVGLVTLFAFTQPLDTDSPEPRPYNVEYNFDYIAVGMKPNPVYESGELVYGQPIFLNIVDEIDSSVTYSVKNPNAQISSGKLLLRTVLVGSAGWTREIARSEIVEFTGLEASANLRINFREVFKVAEENDALTGTSSTLNLRLIAETLVDGQIFSNGYPAAELMEETMADIVFNVRNNTANVMLPKRSQEQSPEQGLAGIVPGTAGASSITGYASVDSGYASVESGYLSEETGYLSEETALLSPRTGIASGEDGQTRADSTDRGALSPRPVRDPSVKNITQMVPTQVQTPNSLNLGVIQMPVGTARNMSVMVLLVLLFFAGYSTLVLASAKKKGELSVLVARYRKRLIPMSTMKISDTKDIVDVDTFDALYAISNENEQLIMMHQTGKNAADFYISDNGSNYRYSLQSSSSDNRSSDNSSSDDSNERET